MQLDFESSLKRALLLLREFRLHVYAQGLDARAVRVVLKFALLVDTEAAKGKISKEEEAHMDKLARELLEQVVRE